MALRGARRSQDIPEGAVVLNEMQAMAHQGNLINKWQPQSEVLFLRYGLTMLGTAVGINSFFINTYIRQQLKLFKTASGTSILLTGGSSIILLCGTHLALIRRKMFLSGTDICPACIDTRGILAQNVAGILQPLIAASAVNFGIAYKTATVNMPNMTDIKRMSRYWWSVIKPFSRNLVIMALCNSIFASVVMHKELQEFQRVQESLRFQESMFEEQGAMKQTFRL